MNVVQFLSAIEVPENKPRYMLLEELGVLGHESLIPERFSERAGSYPEREGWLRCQAPNGVDSYLHADFR